MTTKADQASKINRLGERGVALSSEPLSRVPRCRSGSLQMPLELIESGVFGAAHVGKARMRDREVAVQGARGSYRLHGRALTQAHADVYMVALERLAEQEADRVVRVPLASMNRALGRHGGADKLRGLRGMLLDLATNVLECELGPRSWKASGLLMSVEIAGDEVELAMNRGMLDVMSLGICAVDEALRHAVGNRPLAQWLQLCLVAAPMVTLETVRRRVAPEQDRDRVRRRVRAAADELQKAGLLVRFDRGADAVLRVG